MFRALASDSFPPFGKLRLDLPPVENKPPDLAEVHVFTGVNGTGKTRLLAVLAAMLGNPEPMVKRSKRTDEQIFIFANNIYPAPDEFPRWGNRLAITANNAHWSAGGGLAQWTNSIPAFAYS